MTELIDTSAEHHFLTTLSSLQKRPNGWYGLYFSLSKMLNHGDLSSNLETISSKVAAAQRKRDAFLERLSKQMGADFKGFTYAFTDFDVLVLVCAASDQERLKIEAVFKALAAELAKGYAHMSELTSAFRGFEKMADDKILSGRRIAAYCAMADKHKVKSIGARRGRREDPLVMVVEDDRFTMHYASSILSKEYDLISSKNGEDAIGQYIENAPDIVFLDIHLPGLSGHEVLQSILAVDPKAFVVMLSVDSVADNIRKARQLGADKFIKKPFSIERLIETVKHSPYVKAMTFGATPMGSRDMIH